MLNTTNFTIEDNSNPTRRDHISLIIIIGSIIYILFYIVISKRIWGLLLSFTINLFLRKKLISFFFSSISFSPISGRIIIYGLRYTTESYSIHSDVSVFQLNWRCLFSSDLDKNPFLHVTIRRLRYHLFYRKDTYSKLRDVFKRNNTVLENPSEEQTHNSENLFFPSFYKISFDVKKGSLVFGNQTVPALLVFRFDSAQGNFCIEPTPYDIYKYVFVARTKSMKIFISPTPTPTTKFNSQSPFFHITEQDNLFLESDIFMIKYRSDEPGIATDLSLPPPEYSMSVWLSPNSHIYYSPWCNQFRLLLQRLFFPWDYSTRPVDHSEIGKKRLFERFFVKFLIFDKSQSSPSNIYIHLGFHDLNAAKISSSVLNLTLSKNSRLTINYPWRELEDGHTPQITGDLSNIHIFSSTFSLPELANVKNLEFSLSMHFPRKWNGLQKWTYNFKVEHARVNFVFAHLNLFDSLLDDWNRLPEQAPDIQTFVPIDWEINADFNCYQIFTFLNQYNWIDNTLHSNNTQLAFVGKRGRISVSLPFTEHHPLRQRISFTVLGEDIIGRLYLPQSLSIRNSVFCLGQCNDNKWNRLINLHECLDCVNDPKLGNANEDDWLTLGLGPYLLIESTFTYTPETHEEQVKSDNPNNLQLFIDITDLYARFYGSLITVLLNLKDNYPGEYQNHQPYTDNGPGIPYGGIQTPGKLKPSPLEVELVFNLKQAFLDLPKYPHPWENDPPLLPTIYLHSIEISFHRTLHSSAIRVITEPIFVISPSSKQGDSGELEMGFGFSEGIEFYGHSMVGETTGEWQEYAWLVEAKLGDIHANCSLSQLSEVVSWLQTAVTHAASKGDDYSYPPYQYCPGVNSERDSISGNKLKYQFIIFNVCPIKATIYQDGVSLLVDSPGVRLELCNLHTCTFSHGLTLLTPSISASVLIPSMHNSDWIEVGCINTGQILIQSEINQVVNVKVEKQREFLTEADLTKELWFLYPELAKRDRKGNILCGCRGGCFFFGRCEMSHLVNWLPHLMMARDSRYRELSQRLDGILTPIGDILCSFSNLNSLFYFIFQFYTRSNSNRASESAASHSLERFLSTNTADSIEISETLSFRSAFSHVSSVSSSRMSVASNTVSDNEKKCVQEAILSEYDFNIKLLHSHNSFHLSQMVFEIRKINASFFPDAKDVLYQTPIDALTFAAYSTDNFTQHQLVFSLTNFSLCKTSRLTIFPTGNVPTPKSGTMPNDASISQVKLQIHIMDDVHIHVVTSIFKAIMILIESVQDSLATQHPLHILDKIKNDSLSSENTRADLVDMSAKAPDTISIGAFANPNVNLYFTLVRNSPIFHHIDTLISNDEKRRCVFYSFISLILSPSLVQLQISKSSASRGNITSSNPNSNILSNEVVQVGFHFSVLYLYLQSGLLYSLAPDYTFENVYQAFEHIPYEQTRCRKKQMPEDNQLLQLSQFEAGLDEIMVTGCLKDRNDRETKLVESWWSELSHTNNLNGSVDVRCSAFWFNLPCPRDIDLIKRHVAPSWITTLILFIDEVQTEVTPILQLAKNLMALKSSWSQDIFISMASVCIGSWLPRSEVNTLLDRKSKFIRSSLALEFLDMIQGIILTKPESLILQHIPTTLHKKIKQKILDSILALFIFNQISINPFNPNLEILWNDLVNYFTSTSQRNILYSLFGSFDSLFSQLNFTPNNFKSELTSFNVYLQIQDVFILISSPPQGRSRIVFDSPPLLSIQPCISTIKIMNNSPLCRIPRYHSDANEEPQHRIKLQIRSTLRVSKLSLHFEVEDMILIYSSILGLNTHLFSMRDAPPKSSNICSLSHHEDANSRSRMRVNNSLWKDCTENWVQLNDQYKCSLHASQSNLLPNIPEKDNSFIFSSLQDKIRYQRIGTSDVETGSTNSNTSTPSNFTTSFSSEDENHINLFFILHIDDTMIFSPDEVNFSLSFQSVTFSTLLKGNFNHFKSHLSLREDFTAVITIGVNEGKLQITDSDTQADLLYSYLSPVNGLAMLSLKNGYKEYRLLPSLENLHYLVHLNLTDLNLSILRPPDLLFDSISKISLKLLQDFSTLVNSYKSLEVENSKYTHRRDSSVYSPLFFHDRSLPFNLPSGSILLDFHSAVLNIEALESISLQYEFNGFIISLNTAPQNMRLSIIIDLHVIIALSKITGKPYDTLNIPKIMTSFEVKSLKPITFIPELSIQSINLHFSVDLINQITALVVAYLYEIRKLYYELKPYLPKTSYESSNLAPQSDPALTFSILDLLHSVIIHLDPINVSLTSSPGLSMRFTTTTLDINIKNPNSFNNRRNVNKIQSGKFILMEKIQVDISLSLAIALAPQQEPCYEIAYFRTSVLAEDSISSDIHEKIEEISSFVDYSDSKHLFLLTIVNPHLFLPTFAMENIFTYIIQWHGGYLFWQKQIRHHDYSGGIHTPTIPIKNNPDRFNQTPAFFDFFSSTIFMITVNDLGVCIPVTYQPRLTSNIPLHALLCTVATTSVSALFGKKSGAVGTLKDFRIGFQSQFNPNRKLWSISNVTSGLVNSGCVERGTCKLCLTYSLDDFLQAKRDRVHLRLVFDMTGIECHMDSGIGYYVSALVKSITNLASGIEAIQESTGYETQRLNYIPEESSDRTHIPSDHFHSKSGNKHEDSVQNNHESIPSVSDKEFSSLVSDTIRNTPSLRSSIDSGDRSIDDEVIHRKQDDFVGFLLGIDLDVNVSIKIAHGKLLIDSTERSQSMEGKKYYKRFVSYPSYYSPGFVNDLSSDETSGSEFGQATFSDISTLYIPGLDISVSFVSSIQSENKFVSGNEAINVSSYAKSQTARLHALVMIRSVPKEMRILPALVEFLDKIAQPISNFAQSTSFLLGPTIQTEHPQNIFSSYTQSSQFFPIDVLISVQLQPLVVKLTCLPISRVEAILQTPQIETMCSFTIYKKQQENFQSSYSYNLLKSDLNKKEMLNLYFITDINLTFYLSKLSLSVSSYLVTKHEETGQARTRDALRIQLDRAKFNLFRRKTNYSLDMEYSSLPASTVDLSLVAVIGKLFFNFDMRRLTDVATFRKCWYRQGLTNLLFLGATLAHAHPSETKPPKIKVIEEIETASIILFCLQILECEVKCNLAELMGDCNLNSKSLGINGYIGHQGQKLLLLSLDVLVDDTRFFANGGVIAGHIELNNANAYVKSDCQNLPSHEFSLDVNSFDGRLKYMGLTVLTFETSKIKTQGRDSWKQTSNDLTLKLLVDIKWEMFRMMLTRSTFDSILKIVYRLQKFIEDQRQRSRKMLTRLLPPDGPPVLVSFVAKMDNEKQIEPPIKKIFSISWLWAVKKGVFKLIEHLGFNLAAQSDLHLGGDMNITGEGFAIAFSPADNFLIDSWTVVAIKELVVNFNTDAIPGLILEQQELLTDSFAHRICQQSFHIELGYRKKEFDLEEKAGVYKVVRTKGPVPPADSSNSEWLDYACIESKLGITSKQKRDQSPKYKIKLSPIPILSFPSFYINLITDHFCTFKKEFQDFESRVECNFDSNFYGEVAVTTNVDLYLFLHDLFKCYIEKLKSLAENQGVKKKEDESGKIFVDSRKFNCEKWHLEPMLNVMSMVSWGSGSVNPHIDWLLDKLSLNKARTTIPKCIQRGAMDPIDHLISLCIMKILLFSGGKKSFSDFK